MKEAEVTDQTENMPMVIQATIACQTTIRGGPIMLLYPPTVYIERSLLHYRFSSGEMGVVFNLNPMRQLPLISNRCLAVFLTILVFKNTTLTLTLHITFL